MGLQITWFIIIAFFWTGFFILEGFDLGVGSLHMLVGKTDIERRVAINSIGPFWDGNEVWLIVAGAGMFAAFPAWYASMFSALYLALMLILLSLIIRGVSFEYRGKISSPRWRATWDWCLTVGSVLLPVLLGIGLGDLLSGLPINKDGTFTGSFWNLFTAYGIWFGVTLLALTLAHGAMYLSLKTTGTVQARAQRLAGPFSWVAVLALAGFALWTHVQSGRGVLPEPPAGARLPADRGGGLVRQGRPLGMGLRRDHRRHCRHHGIVLGVAVSERHGLQHQRRLQPDGGQRGQQPLHPGPHDRRGDRVYPARAGLSRLELLRVPGPHQGTGRRGHARTGRRRAGAVVANE